MVTMEQAPEQLKAAIHQILGNVASDILLGNLDNLIDGCGGNPECLGEACKKAEKMVNLFIGVNEAKVIGNRCREILDKT